MVRARVTSTTTPTPADTDIASGCGRRSVTRACPAPGRPSGCAQSAAGQRTVMCLPCDGGQPETAGPATPVLPPVAPMAATRVTRLPTGPGWVYEPKLDGFIN